MQDFSYYRLTRLAFVWGNRSRSPNGRMEKMKLKTKHKYTNEHVKKAVLKKHNAPQRDRGCSSRIRSAHQAAANDTRERRINASECREVRESGIHDCQLLPRNQGHTSLTTGLELRSALLGSTREGEIKSTLLGITSGADKGEGFRG